MKTIQANPYFYPEKLGLQIVAELQFSYDSHDYDLRVVWKKLDTGKLFTARDSGNSATIRFDEYQSISKLSRLNFDELRREVLGDKSGNFSPEAAQEFLKKARDAK
jgi:hypothetical protein